MKEEHTASSEEGQGGKRHLAWAAEARSAPAFAPRGTEL